MKKRCLIVLGLVWLLSGLGLTTPTPAAAAPDEVKWSGVNIPTEGKPGNWVLANGSDVHHLTMDIDGALYAGIRGLTYTLYKSTDGGYSWSYTGNVKDNIVDIATVGDDANVVYYATSSRIYKSTDAGISFVSLLPNPGGAGSNNIEITSIDVARLGDNNFIVVGTRDTDVLERGGVYILDESELLPGWVNTNVGSYDVYAVAFSPHYAADRQVVAVVTDEVDTMVTTKLGGTGWGAMIGDAKLDRDNSGTSIAASNSAAIAFPGDYDITAGDSVLFVAIDAGGDSGDVYMVNSVEAPGSSMATDLNVGSVYGLSNLDITTLVVTGNATTAHILAGAAGSARVYFSYDGGVSWARSTKPPTGGSETYVLMAPDFSSSGRAYAATSGTESAFSYTPDGGIMWNQLSLIDTLLSAIVDLAISPGYSHDEALFMLTRGGEDSLWRSLNGGTTWERVYSSSLANVDSIDLVELSPRYGKGSQVVYIAGSSGGSGAIWKSKDNGQKFICRIAFDPTTGASFSIRTWAVVDDDTLFIGSYDGSNGLVYCTTSGGFFYSARAEAGSHSLNSMALSTGYEQDRSILVGNTCGWVYWSYDGGASFESLGQQLPLSATGVGKVTVAFDPDYSSNKIVYAASDAIATTGSKERIYRFKIGASTSWESIDSTLPVTAATGSVINQLVLSADGTLYGANSMSDGGIERCLNPTYSLGPAFETVTHGLDNGATLTGLWLHDDWLWSIDTTNNRLITYTDSLAVPVTLTLPVGEAQGISTRNVSLDWEALPGATSYKWQLDYDTDFSAVPTGFENTTSASSARLPALESAIRYYWRVRAIQPVLSPWSAKWSFTTSLGSEIVALKLLSPEAGAGGVQLKPVFQWSAIAGAHSYELLVANDVSFASPIIVKTGAYALPATAWQCDVNLNCDTTYYWKVRATGSDTRSAWSAVGAFTTEPPPPSPSAVQSPAMLSPAPPPLESPPSPPPAPPQSSTPDWMEWLMYLGGALLLTMMVMLIVMIILTVRISRL